MTDASRSVSGPTTSGLVPPGTPSQDVWRRLRPVEALQRDIVAVLTRPAVVGRFWVDLGEADRFVRAQASGGGGPRLTLTHLFVKAAALSALASPRIHRMYGPLRVLEPAHADVGVSVQGQEILAPVVVLREADRKPLAGLAEELRSATAEARQKEARDAVLVNRYLKLFPFPALRRLLIRAFWLSPKVRRQAVGTLQFSNIGHFGIDSAEVPVVGELLLVGGVLQKRPIVDPEGRVSAGLGAQFAIHGSHRKINGQTAGEFIASFRALLAEPERLR